MSKGIDVWQIAKEIEEYSVPETRKEIEEFISSLNGQSFTPGEIIEKVIGPLIGKVGTANKAFTIELVQRVVDELQKDD